MSDNMDCPVCEVCGFEAGLVSHEKCHGQQPDALPPMDLSWSHTDMDITSLTVALAAPMRQLKAVRANMKADLAVVEQERAAFEFRTDAIRQKYEREEAYLISRIEPLARLLLDMEPERKSRELAYGTIKTRHTPWRFEVEDEKELEASLTELGRPVPRNKPGKASVSIDGLTALLVTLHDSQLAKVRGVRKVEAEERFSVETET